MFNATGYSLSDIAAATGGNNRNNDGFLGGDGWWIILLFLFAGWGNNGNGGFGLGNRGGQSEVAYGFDMNNLENGIRGIQQGLCDGFYAQNTTALQGFTGIQNTLCQGFNGIQNQLATDALSDQKCCCETQNLITTGFSNLNYNLATQGCDTRRAIADSTRDIIDNANGNTRQILDFLTQDKIATLTAENQALKFAASQATQNAFITANQEAQTAELIRRLGRDCPIPAYVVPNPNCCYGNYQLVNTGCGNGYNYNSCCCC